MANKNKLHQVAQKQFLAYKQKFGPVQPDHLSLNSYYSTVKYYPRRKAVYLEGNEDKTVFFICSGLLARVVYEEDEKTHKEKRRILSVGLPNMAMTTTEHLFSNKQLPGDLIALRPSVIIQISYSKLLAFKEQDQTINSMIAALGNKKHKQLSRLRRICFIEDLCSRYIEFTKRLPELREVLSQNEQQDLLEISRSTIQRTSYFLVKGVKKR